MARVASGIPARHGASGLPWALAGLTAAAWAAMAVWGASPQARWLDHGWQPDTLDAQLLAVAAFVVGWTLMVTAMMLPSAAALVAAFGRTTHRRHDRGKLRVLVACGFLGTWLGVGCAFQLLDRGVHVAVEHFSALEAHPELLTGAALVLAGGFQFTGLKRRCLTACRMPQGFVYRQWGARGPWRDAMSVGTAYGRSCVGCCWALMLVAFAVGMANLGWMLILAAITTAEKSGRAAPWLVRGAGAALVAGGLAVAAG